MIDTLKKLECSLVTILPEGNNIAELNISDAVESYEGYIDDFKVAIELLGKTIVEDDKIAIQCALTRVRIASLNLSNTYQDIIDDVVLINKYESWPVIPDGYQIPEHYNYPKK